MLRNGTGETVVRIDPGTLAQQPIAVPGGVEGLAVGKGAVRVGNLETGDSVTRIDARTIPRRSR